MPEITKRSVFVRTSFVAWHYWPEAAGVKIEPGSVDISYLARVHRHRFGVEVSVSTSHNDREVEFHQLLHDTVSPIINRWNGSDLGRMSCEDMASHLLSVVAGTYPDRAYLVEVSEDGECGARVQA